MFRLGKKAFSSKNGAKKAIQTCISGSYLSLNIEILNKAKAYFNTKE